MLSQLRYLLGIVRSTGAFSLRLICLFTSMLAVVATDAIAQQTFYPARYRDGMIPPLPNDMIAGGGLASVQVLVVPDGTVQGVNVVTDTPPYTETLIVAVRSWRFTPAMVEAVDPVTRRLVRTPVESTVLVAIAFGAPTLVGGTLGESPRSVNGGFEDTPVPVAATAAPFPPAALMGGVVLIETTVGLSGRASQNRVIQSAPPFDFLATAALDQWTFRPARIRGVLTPAIAYILFGFRQPVIVPAFQPPPPTPSPPSIGPSTPTAPATPRKVFVPAATAPLAASPARATPPARATLGR
jgi:hypothetical protein